MEATVEEINSVQRRVKVSVKAENVNKAFAEAYRQLQGKASIKGFRKGKVPINIIKKVYQQNAAAEVADKLIKEHLFAAIEQNQIRPIASPALESVDLPRHDEQYSFSAIVDVMPAMTLGNYKGLKVKVDIPKVTSSTVDKEIETLQKNHAKTKVVAGDQAARPGNLAHVSQTATLDGEPCPALAFTRTAVEVGAGHLLPVRRKILLLSCPRIFPTRKSPAAPSKVTLSWKTCRSWCSLTSTMNSPKTLACRVLPTSANAWNSSLRARPNRSAGRT